MAKLPGSARRSNGGHSAAHHIAYADQRITKNARPLGKPQATTKASHQLAYPQAILVPMGLYPGPATPGRTADDEDKSPDPAYLCSESGIGL